RWCPSSKTLISLFCARNRQSRLETFQPANGPFLEFRKKFFPATQNSSSAETFSSEKCVIYYLCFSAIFSFSVIYFSTPPGVFQNKKSPSHFAPKTGICWRREWDSNPRGRDAQRLSCQPTNMSMRVLEAVALTTQSSRLDSRRRLNESSTTFSACSPH